MNDPEIYNKAAQVLMKGGNVALITVISTTGSTPGKVGYKMLVWGKKRETLGTIGGGLVEAEVIDKAGSMLPTPENRVIKIDFAGTEDNERGICGGSIEFLIETFDENSLPLFKELSTVIDRGNKGVLASVILPNKPPNKVFLQNADQLNSLSCIDLTHEIMESVKQQISQEQPAKKTLENGVEVFIEPICERPMVFIFGGGHLACHISQYAKSLNFRVTVCDDRAEFANKERFPDADCTICDNFETVFDKCAINKNSYIVIVTKGHKYDEIVLEQAVKTDAKYIGMIGSKRKTLTILKKLSEKGIPEKALARVYSPIGISIGAVTPQEIALSIVCELVKIRRLGRTPETKHLTIAPSNN
jgi:xanthine dehydrogenase accessory factor